MISWGCCACDAAWVSEDLPAAVAGLAQWSSWQPFTAQSVAQAPVSPGVYLFRRQASLVYVGQAGERRGRGLRGRLGVYVLGGSPHSGLGGLALERALNDAAWLGARVVELQGGQRRTVREWSALAVHDAGLHVCWSATSSPGEAVALERAVLDALRDQALWNRRR